MTERMTPEERADDLTDWPHGEAMTVFKTGGLINERPRKDRNEKAA